MNPPSPTDLTKDLTPEEQSLLGDLKPLQEHLDRYELPEPAPAARARLVNRLKAELAGSNLPETGQKQAGRATNPPPPPAIHPSRLNLWLRLARSQVSLFEARFWWANALVVLFGLALGSLATHEALPVILLILSPVLTAASVAYAFTPETRSFWELEQFSAIHPLELFYTRLGVVLSANLLFSAIFLVCVWLWLPQMILWRLIVIWLGLLLCLTGIALFTTARWGAIAGVGIPLGLWFALILASQWYADAFHLNWNDLILQAQAAINSSNQLLWISAAVALIGVFFIGEVGLHWRRKTPLVHGE